ncbi:hypothetical protein KAH51_10355 [Proteus vulgaris]|uniref:hypothetical protein n=1 Tax=Proteus TaxID=583 RepID=UPI000D68F43E|nr:MULTISPECIES: hypothetical protein [Proteus]MBQ0213860.1 hypothetical protein [Proteus vulgaris]
MFIYAKNNESKNDIIIKLEESSFYATYIEPNFQDIEQLYKDEDINKEIRDSWYLPDILSEFDTTRSLYKRQKGGLVSLITGSKLSLGKIDKSKEELQELYDDFILTKNELSPNTEFQVNHPIDKFVYKKHPDNNSYPNLMIDIATYSTILNKLKETELIDILIQLGATKIELNKINSNSKKISSCFEFGLQYGSADIHTESTTDSKVKETIIYELEGKKFSGKLDRSKYIWINNEPEWNNIIAAREEGNSIFFQKEISLSSLDELSAEQNTSVDYNGLNPKEKIEFVYNNSLASYYSLLVTYRKKEI